MLELHCHTTYSDGSLTPEQLVSTAKKKGVRALAITDHDTLSGIDEAIAFAGNDLEIVPGVELSTVYNECSLHILGFYPDREKLNPPLRERTQGRWRRAQEMVDKLTTLGYAIDFPKLKKGQAPCRPHIATALREAGYIQTNQEAFERWLGEGKPAYVQYEKFSSIDGIELLRKSHTVPVWAHPYLFRGGDVEEVLKVLVEGGLMGVEVYHPTHSEYQIHKLEIMCQEYGLLMTGGSDYHGPFPDGKETTVLNMLHLSLELLEPLKEAAKSLL